MKNSRRARKKKNFTQAEVAEAVGVDTKTVKRWEDNHGTPRGHNCRKLCDLFKATSEDLKLGNTSNNPTKRLRQYQIQMSVEEVTDDIGQLDVEEPAENEEKQSKRNSFLKNAKKFFLPSLSIRPTTKNVMAS